MKDAPDDAVTGYLAEYEFIREGLRQDQRERQGFLGFALAASGLILGLLMRSESPRPADEVWFLVLLTGGATLVAELMTIRASRGVASGGAYMRIFIEPKVRGRVPRAQSGVPAPHARRRQCLARVRVRVHRPDGCFRPGMVRDRRERR